MRSALAYRLLVVLFVAAAAVLAYLRWPDEATRSASDAPASVHIVPRQDVPSPLAGATSAVKKQAASGVPTPGAPAASASDGRAADPADQFARAMAAAERNGATNRSAAQAANGQAALDMFESLMREQTRKEPLPLVSPFGENRQAERAR